jgi:hypothetical protein
MPALLEDCTSLNTTATGKKFQKKTRISSQTNYLDLTSDEKIATAAKTINFIDSHLVPTDHPFAIRIYPVPRTKRADLATDEHGSGNCPIHVPPSNPSQGLGFAQSLPGI